LYFIWVNRNNYLIAKTLAMGGCQVWVRSEIPLENLVHLTGAQLSAEHEYSSWLFSDEHIRIVSDASPAPEVDVLLYEIGHLRPKFAAELCEWMSKSARAVAWNTNEHERVWWRNLRAELAALVRFFRFLPRTRTMIMQSGRLFFRPTALFSHARRQGYFVHPKFLREPDLRNEMFNVRWDPNKPRTVRLVFSGNPEPEFRRRLVEQLRCFVEAQPGVQIINHYENLATPLAREGDKRVLWMVRANPHDPRWYLRNDIVPPLKWPGILRLCDFVFCPPGYERKTHRVIESLLQGVIPILDCPQEYDLGLQDNVNCLVVRRGRWQEAMQRALQFRLPDLVRLRKVIKTLAEDHLQHLGSARDLLARFNR